MKNRSKCKRGAFVLSLDFELHWGRFDEVTLESWSDQLIATRTVVIPNLLELFRKYEIRCTWATVGFLFCKKKQTLEELTPQKLHEFSHPNQTAWNQIASMGADEKSAPNQMAGSIIEDIDTIPGQEIATHTLSHYYCLENGASLKDFEIDLLGALKLATNRGKSISSIVFPRNQYKAEHLKICWTHGIRCFRGVERPWCYSPEAKSDESRLKRFARLADCLHPFWTYEFDFPTCREFPINVRQSQFYRSAIGPISRVHWLHRFRIKQGMLRAAKKGKVFHLWFHPHNFGKSPKLELARFEELLIYFSQLKYRYGMRSSSMHDIGEICINASAYDKN